MLAFSLNSHTASDKYAVKVWALINKNLGYFKKFNGGEWQLAVLRTFENAIANRKKLYADGDFDDEELLPYIKKLARNILKNEESKDVPYSITNEDGDISFVYTTLTETISPTENMYGKEIKDVLKDLYLMDKESFMALKVLYSADGAADLKLPRVTNRDFRREFKSLLHNYGSETVFATLLSFYQELPAMSMHRDSLLVRTVALRTLKKDVSADIPKDATIITRKGKTYGIQHDLTMDINPDYYNWTLLGVSNPHVIRVDIAPFMDYLYEEVCVEEGVHTRHIEWCADRCRMVYPDGTVYIGKDTDLYLNKSRTMLIFNLMADNVGKLVAVSPDSLYFRPARSMKEGKIRVKLATGKVLNLAVEDYISKGTPLMRVQY